MTVKKWKKKRDGARPWLSGLWTVAASVLFVSAAWGQTQSISSITPSATIPSGRLFIEGMYFGSSQGASQVLVDGLPALVTQWSDTEIVAYVPESSGLGSVNVEVEVGGLTSSPVPIDVSPSGSEV